MNLEVIEVLALTGEGVSGQHWSRNAARPRYSLSKSEVREAKFTHRFTCFHVAERVEADHDVLFAGRSNGAVVLWRMVPRNLFGGANKNDRVEETLATSLPHKGAVTCLTHTRPGTYGPLGGPLVFSGSTDHTIKAWNAWAGPPFKETCLQTMAEHRGGVTALAFAGDTTLISTARDGSIRLWRPQRGRKLLRFPFFCCVKCLSAYPVEGGGVSRPIGAGQPGAFVNVWSTAACVAGGEDWTLYCGDSDGTVSVFQRTPASVAERVANAGKRSDGLLTMEQIADSEVTLRRRWSHLHSLAVTGLVLVPEHNYLLSIGNDGACRVLDYLQGNTFMTIASDGQHLFTSVAWDLAHEQLVVADASGVVQVWNTYTGSQLLREKVAKATTATGPRWGQGSPALLGFYSSKADGVLYGMCPSENCFFRWKMVKVDGYALLGRHNDSIVGLGFQGKAFAGRRPSTAFDSNCIATTVTVTKAEYKVKNNELIEDAPTAGEMHKCGDNRHAAQSSACGVGVDNSDSALDGCREEEAGFGLVVLSASVDGTVRAWETLGKSEKYRMRHTAGEEVTSMLVLPGGSVLATGTDDGTVRFWRLDTGASESFKAHENAVSALAACRDRRGELMLASAGFEGAIIMWTTHAKDGLKNNRVPKIDHALSRAHGAADGSDCEILCLAFVAADVPLLASAGNDLAVRCWRFQSHNFILLSTLKGHEDSIDTLIADGWYLLSGGGDGAVRVWNVAGLAVGESRLQESSDNDEIGETTAMSIGKFEAHPHGVAGMTIMTLSATKYASIALNLLQESAGDLENGDVVGLLVTCGKAEGLVKIWDYTHVEEDGSCGRLIAEIRSHDESLFNCVACTQDATGEPLIFAGTTEGGILQLAADIGGGESSGGSRRGLDPRQNVDRMGVCGDDIEK